MPFEKILKFFLSKEWFFVILLHIQPSFAMDDNLDETPGLTWLWGLWADDVEKPEQEPSAAFFQASGVELVDDLTLVIFNLVPGTKPVTLPQDRDMQKVVPDNDTIKDYRSIAFTSKKGYYLIGPLLSKTIKSTYFSHLPEKYLLRLEDNTLAPLSSMKEVFQELCEYQLQEIEQLKKILSPNYEPQKVPFDAQEQMESYIKSCLIKYLSDEDKERIFKLHFEQNGAQQGMAIRPPRIGEWLDQENLIRTVHQDLVLKLASREKPQIFMCASEFCAFFSLRGTITRLSLEVVRMIEDFIVSINERVKVHCPGKVVKTFFSLACNNLRWIPDDLFSVPVQNQDVFLDLRNNRLTYLPDTLENFKENLICLRIGNVELTEPRSMLSRIYRNLHQPAEGNLFKTLPSPILKLIHLTLLDCTSVGLKDFPVATIFTSLPNLSILVLDYNHLSDIPTAPEGRKISITNFGNAENSPLPLDGPTACRLYDYDFEPLTYSYGTHEISAGCGWLGPWIKFTCANSCFLGFSYGCGVLPYVWCGAVKPKHM